MMSYVMGCGVVLISIQLYQTGLYIASGLIYITYILQISQNGEWILRIFLFLL